MAFNNHKGFMDGDQVNVKIIDHRIVQMDSGTWALRLRLLHDDKGEIDGYVWLTPKCAGMIRGFLRAVELDPDVVDIRQLDPEHPKGISLLEREVSIICREEEYRGRVSVRVVSIRAARLPLSESDAFFEGLQESILAAKDRNDERKTNAQQGNPHPPAPSKATTENAGDCPF